MAKKKKQKEPEGAPAWMVTYGDMMTLLLCFFVMIVAMSEIKKNEKFRIVMASIHRIFGQRGGQGAVPTDDPVDVAPRVRQHSTLGDRDQQVAGTSPEDIVTGTEAEVKSVRPGEEFKVGTPIPFAEGSAALVPDAYGPLMEIADTIRGRRYKIEVRGHASTVPLPAGSRYRDHLALSTARAMTVWNWLVDAAPDRGRVDSRRVRVAACGTGEPVRGRAYQPSDWRRNDRVDVVQTHDLMPPEATNPGPPVQGAWIRP